LTLPRVRSLASRHRDKLSHPKVEDWMRSRRHHLVPAHRMHLSMMNCAC